MLNEFDSLGEPLQNIIQQLENQHEKEKQGALDQQKEMYEQKLEELRRERTPDTTSGRTSSGYNSEDRVLNSTPTSFYDSQLLYEESLRRLREEVIRANVLVREANQLSSEMKKDADFAVTLQIPTATLSQAASQGPLTSEVAVVVKHKTRGTQVWSVDKLGNKIYDMRDAYQTITENPLEANLDDTDDDGLFFEVECHTLIGVATVWLECLYQNVPLDYSAPVISQQGEVCGRMSVEIRRIQDETTSLSLDGDSVSDEDDIEGLAMGSSVKVQITIKEAHGLPLSLCNYVFGQYTFFDQELSVIPPLNAAASPVTASKSNSMTFNNTKTFTVEVDEDFLDYVTDGSLAIEVYGNRSRGYDTKPAPLQLPQEMDNSKSLVDSEMLDRVNQYRTRWRELSRQLELWVEIHELNEQGFYSPVELLQREGQEAGGVFMLRQGYSRRVVTQVVVPKHNSQGSQGLLPVVIESISNVAVGSVTVRNKTQKGLDSYQERDLQTLRDRFSNSVMKKREYLDQQIQEMINKPNKSQEDKEHEGMLIDQWVSLTEERNAILCPNTGSGVPGATSEWNPLPGMETHIPVIFLDLDDNALSGCGDIDAEPAGHHSFLSFEQSDSIIGLPIMKYDQKRVTATASWDSSIHDSVYLNRVTQNTERVYIILKLTLRLSSPALVNIVLRKRICVRMYKRPSLKDSLRRKFWRQTNVPTRCGVRFELISHIPRQSGEQTEERESLAQKAAEAMHVGTDGEELMDGEAIDKYNKGISHVENILNLHKLRQEVLVKEKLAAVGRSSKSLTNRNMRKYASTPNLFNAPSMSNLWRSQAYPSNSDLNNSELAPSSGLNGMNGELNKNRSSSRASSAGDYLRARQTNQRAKSQNNRYSVGAFNSPSQSPRMALRQYDIDIDGESAGRTTPPRDRLVPRNNTTPVLPSLVESSPTTTEPPQMELLTAKQNLSRTNSKSSNADTDDDEKPTIIVGDEEIPSPRLKVGDVVKITENLEGQVRFYGKTQFADGTWVGIALTVPEGKNNGTVQGVSYFNCDPNHGLFIRAEKLLKS
uniref:CAP-Gly domain-containing protein n=3 Tax=Clytia hemisphaerica TaxID=252671 RepID=A0A7M5UMN0_9CNID